MGKNHQMIQFVQLTLANIWRGSHILGYKQGTATLYLYRMCILNFTLSNGEPPNIFLGREMTWLGLCFRELTLNRQEKNWKVREQLRIVMARR